MSTSTKSLAQQALHKSIEVRTKANYDQVSPICIYALCDHQRVKVRFVDISMEGAYVRGRPATILVSALRPLPRRVYSCAHELGHHVFGHGSTIDELLEEASRRAFNPSEFLVDAFGGFLLMPPVGVRKAFARREWQPERATPLQMFTVACQFGVGYETLTQHLSRSLSLVSRQRAETLLKSSPKAIRAELLGEATPDRLIVADEHWDLPTLDAEVGNSILLPKGSVAESPLLAVEQDVAAGQLFRAARPGIARVLFGGCPKTVFIRVSRHQYVGLSQYRHLEEVEEDESFSTRDD